MKQFAEYDFEDRRVMQSEELEYYKKLFRRCARLLVQSEELGYNKEIDNFYFISTGEYIDEEL